MVVIIITVVTQGALVPSEDRGSFDSSMLIINDGIFQAVGVISFGMFPSDPLLRGSRAHSLPLRSAQPSSATTTPS